MNKEFEIDGKKAIIEGTMGAFKIVWCPGNSTKYTVFVFSWGETHTFVWDLSGTCPAYPFHRFGPPISYLYVFEKLCMEGTFGSITDASELTKLIGAVLGRDTILFNNGTDYES